jgi:hypothetical protein
MEIMSKAMKMAGSIVIGQQYQNHNERPGPVYDRTGYSLMSLIM